MTLHDEIEALEKQAEELQASIPRPLQMMPMYQRAINLNHQIFTLMHSMADSLEGGEHG